MQILFENQINCWQPPPLVQTLDWLAVKDEGILIWHSAVVYGLVFQYYTILLHNLWTMKKYNAI